MPKPVKISRYVHSTHWRERTEPIKYVIIHCSAQNPDDMLKVLDKRGLSVHYIIGRDGELIENLPPEAVAFHAGESRWQQSEGVSLNGCSIGIELECMTKGQRQGDYPNLQILRLRQLLHWLTHKYNIRRENILGHSDIAPTRKFDPGAGFPWHKLYKDELSVWYKRATMTKVTDEKRLLDSIGYDTTVMAAARYAFCRRFIPEEVLIVEDLEELETTPYPKDFYPKDGENYMKLLRATATAFELERRRRYWFMEQNLARLEKERREAENDTLN